MKKTLSLLLALTLLFSLTVPASAEGKDTPAGREKIRPRTIVTTDLECDDINSLLHLLLYANDIDIAAIVISASTHHWVGDGEHTLSQVIDSYQQNGDLTAWRPMQPNELFRIIQEEYAAVYPNLVQHDALYPSPEELESISKIGNVQFEGDTRFDTEGSDLIKSILLDDDMRTLYVQAWGGTNTFARALKSIDEEYRDTEGWETIYQKVCAKTVLISWGDQDNTYPDYIAVSWPDMGRLYCVQNGMIFWNSVRCPVPYRKYFEPEWMTENIKFEHGALMSHYLLLGDGTYYEGENETEQYGMMDSLFNGAIQRYAFISEGDSPCWMYLLPVGLRGTENPEYGSWGGRMTNSQGGSAISEYNPTTGRADPGYSVNRWIPPFMNDWAARADWCVKDFSEANHPPVVWTTTKDARVGTGKSIELNGFAEDPDGDSLHCNWYVYRDACVYGGEKMPYVDVWAHDTASTTFTVPADAANGDVFNLVLEVTDDGEPALTRYAQVIVTVGK